MTYRSTSLRDDDTTSEVFGTQNTLGIMWIYIITATKSKMVG
jgi:hypothetical protein